MNVGIQFVEFLHELWKPEDGNAGKGTHADGAGMQPADAAAYLLNPLFLLDDALDGINDS